MFMSSIVADMANGIGGVRNGSGLLFVLKAYFDDSGTHEAADAVAWGGLIGHADQWERLAREWKIALATPRDGRTVRYYHRFEAQNAMGEFSGWKRPATEALTYDLRKIILDSGLYGYSAGTFKKIWPVVSEPWDFLIKGPEAFCFSECMRWAREWSAQYANGVDVALVFNEDKQETAIREARLLHNKIYGGLAGVMFLESKPNPEIQAADMIVGESWNDLVNWKNDGCDRAISRHLQQLIDSERFSSVLVDEEMLSKTLGRFREGSLSNFLK